MKSALNIISLGAGVQSSTMALMAKHGEITPMPDCAIFADTQAEPANVYAWLEYLKKQLPFPVYTVTAGPLEELSLRHLVSKKTGLNYIKTNIPAFTKNPDGSVGIFRRQCTQDFKIVPIRKKIRELVGRRGKAIQWIGISLDEFWRMKDNKVKYIKNIWPLIDKRMNRNDCIEWMKENGYPRPPRSACYFCPYHSDKEWLNLSEDDKNRAIIYEGKMQAAFGEVSRVTSVPFLHSSCQPIQKFFSRPKNGDLFENNEFLSECEGYCGF